ncbi:SGNH/GDSL hydrolase family protein [Rhodospirillaceae bacterium SYSU D60014]|uniref:SGNH/GDSL hydrolase family protein n=1 Tax=Virgifigura deserti TaxID=2268457 RepID=UPI0013C4C387
MSTAPAGPEAGLFASAFRSRSLTPLTFHLSTLIALLLSAGLTFDSARAAPLGFDSIYVFGDSFADVGNHSRLTGGEIPSPPYFEGRFANGPIWVDHLAEKAGLTLKPSETGFDPASDRAVSFGYGGAGTGAENFSPARVLVPGLQGQVANFRSALGDAGTTADPDALYILAVGSNDYLLNVTSGPAQTVGNIATAIEQLADAGARNFLVPNLPDLGMTPAVVAGGVSEFFTALTLGHNQLLAATLSDLEAARPGIDIASPDVFGLFETILANPEAFGFSSSIAAGPASGCIFPPFICRPVGETDTFFWDEVHPTTEVHRLLADAAQEAMAVPEPPVALLIGTGLVAIGVARTLSLSRLRERAATPSGRRSPLGAKGRDGIEPTDAADCR